MWVTFRDGQSALTAAQKQFVQVCGVNLAIKLKTENWIQRVELEILLCTPNTVTFCDSQIGDYNSLGIPEVPSRPKSPPNLQQAPLRPAPPGRPPLPKSPQASPKHQPQQHHHHHPKVGVISLGAEVLMASKLHQKPAVPPSPLVPTSATTKTTPPIEEYASSSPILGSPAHGSSSANTPSQDTGAIYEEINDDIAIPEPRGPPPPPPRCDVYDLDVVSNNKSNKSSPPGTSGGSSGAGSPQSSMPAASQAPPKTNPPPLPVRRGVPPPIPNRSGGAPPLPARPNNP